MAVDDNLIQDAVAELQLLAIKKPLEGANLSRAKELMKTLRTAGYTNQEVSDLTSGAWTEPTIKQYTRGVEVVDSSAKRSEISLMSEMVRVNLSFEDIKFALSLKSDLESKGLNLNYVSQFLAGAAKVGLTVGPLVLLSQDLSKIMPDPTIDNLADVVVSNDMLKKLGVGPLELKNFCNMAKKHGGMNGMLNSINAFESLKAIQDEAIKVSGEKEQVQKKIDGLKSDIKELEHEKEAFRRPSRLYDDLQLAGFDVISLNSLSYICHRHNTSAGKVLDAVKDFTNLSEIRQEVEQAKARRIEEDRLLKEAKEKRAHFQDVLNMCDELLNKFSYSITAIQELQNTAQKYGAPLEVIRAVEKYGSLKRIEAEVEKLSEEKIKLTSSIQEMHKQLQGLQATAETIRESAKGLLEPLSAELTKTVENTFQKITSVYSESLSVMKRESEEYAKRLADAKILEEELNLARVLHAMIKFPTQANTLPLDYAMLLLDSVGKFCWARGIDPKISLKEAGLSENSFCQNESVYLHELVYAARTTLLRGTVPVSR
jgi:predicted  nucleic acid-binding Zn-ribbon protein